MKYLIILGDGMADRPIKQIDNKTPLMVAKKPSIDELAAKGQNGLLKTIPDDMPTGSAVANLSVMGYDPKLYFSGRGVLEAANMGVELEENDLALRCNLLTIESGNIKNHSAGHISTEEAAELIDTLNEKLGDDRIRFHAGISYKHLLVIKDGKTGLECFPPHDYPNTPFEEVLVKTTDETASETSALLNELIRHSQKILGEHPVNLTRIEMGKDPANSIWPWSPGKKPKMPLFKELYNLDGAVISAVDLINGIGVYAGLEIIKVEGATGLYDTNYEGKAEAAIETLKRKDFLYLHIEATDEAGHEGDVDLKIKCIEYLDHRVVKYILANRDQVGDELAIAVLPDHPTPAEMRIHTREAIPFIIHKPGIEADTVEKYDEESAKSGKFGTLHGIEFMKAFLSD